MRFTSHGAAFEGGEGPLPDLSRIDYPRDELVEVFTNYQKSIGNQDEAVRRSLKRLETADCVVTGQQVGFFGGPAYTVLKGITAIHLARQHNAVPIFWIASEDHDVAEVSSTYALSGRGDLTRYGVKLPEGRFVEDITLQSMQEDELVKFAKAMHLSTDVIEASERYVDVGIRELVRLFEGTGLLFIEPKELRPMATQFFADELEHAVKYRDLLIASREYVVDPPLKFAADGTNLFFKDDNGMRTKIVVDGDKFRGGDKLYTKDELVASSGRLSTNVAARPALQSLLIPTLIYVAGPTERRYFAQLEGYFKARRLPMPRVAPRLSATFIPKRAAEWMERLHLEPWRSIPNGWGGLPEDASPVGDHVSTMLHRWQTAADKLFSDVESQALIADEMERLRPRLTQRLTRLAVQQEGIPRIALHYLTNLLRPFGQLQERALNWAFLQSETETPIIESILGIWPEIIAHQYIYLD